MAMPRQWEPEYRQQTEAPEQMPSQLGPGEAERALPERHWQRGRLSPCPGKARPAQHQLQTYPLHVRDREAEGASNYSHDKILYFVWNSRSKA